MFTGIITDIGEVKSLENRGDLHARIGTSYDTAGIDLGASIACNGVCLTVVALGPDWFDVVISAETLAKTNLAQANLAQTNPSGTTPDGAPGWAPGSRINLERALKVGDELGGHIVSGHVDGVARIVSMVDEGESTRIRFEAPETLACYIAPKGSVALNGTSLTVNEVEGCVFGVNIIPHTKQVTVWGDAAVGDLVNLEIDTLARYVARLRAFD